MLIGGIDPSLSGTGLVKLRVTPGPTFELIYSLTVTHSKKRSRGAKLRAIAFEALALATNPYEGVVEHVVMETPFKGEYASAVMALCEVRGAILSHWADPAFPSLMDAPPHDIEPKVVKKVITGNGNANKAQVALAVQRRLGMDHPLPENEADACAVAMAWVLLHPELCPD